MAVDAGDAATALREITAALALDKDFLAAQALRDQILSMPGAAVPPASGATAKFPAVLPGPTTPVQAAPPLPPVPVVSTAAAAPTPIPATLVAPISVAATAETAPSVAPTSVAPTPSATAFSTPTLVEIVTAPALPVATAAVETVSVTAPLPLSSPAVSVPPVASGEYAKFEQRAKRRRVDRRIEAARAALEQQRFKAAAAALDEVMELDPNLPELVELTARFDTLRRGTATHRRGPWVAAVGVFAGALLAATWLQDSSPILSRQIVAAAPLPAALSGTISEMVPEVAAAPVAATPGVRASTASAAPAEFIPHIPEAGAVLPAVLRPAPPPVELPPAVHVAEPVRAAPELAAVVGASAPAIVPASAPVPPIPAPSDEGNLVKQTLQRYRSAYEGLDARSAQAVWPAVNEAALARAFDGLASQSLTFEACDVRLRSEAATATCHGSARYVTKIGSRDPHVEPRIWNFTLRKAGGEWKIDSARTERERRLQ